MISDIYIIGDIPEALPLSAQKRFYEAQKRLEKFNIQVYNPVDSFLRYNDARELAFKENFSSLVKANAVYILNDSSTENNVEIGMALKLNKLIMHES